MGLKIKITIEDQNLLAELNDSACAEKIARALPLEFQMSRWGDEYYGSCGVKAGLEQDARTLMQAGEIAYWPPARALCIFFGPTPASSGPQPEAASEVNPVGSVTSDCSVLKSMGSTVKVKIYGL
ncbi:MAG: hypothetical protein JW822_11685 [Spirochaetales bacterium]|nr:hypothetical protein [Spirochaetales bacterium]